MILRIKLIILSCLERWKKTKYIDDTIEKEKFYKLVCVNCRFGDEALDGASIAIKNGENVVDGASTGIKSGDSIFKEVNIYGNINSELDEVDVVNGIIYEDKSAVNLYMANSNVPQTEVQWALKQIFRKGSNRILALQQESITLSSSVSTNVPTVEDLKDIRKFVFRIDADTPELRRAVQTELDNLKLMYPKYSFSVIYGNSK